MRKGVEGKLNVIVRCKITFGRGQRGFYMYLHGLVFFEVCIFCVFDDSH